MKIEFEKVGRSGASWTAEHPNARTVEDLCCDEYWWLRQLRGKVMSEPDWYYDLDRGRVVILAGVRCVGFARVVGEAVPVRKGGAS